MAHNNHKRSGRNQRSLLLVLGVLAFVPAACTSADKKGDKFISRRPLGSGPANGGGANADVKQVEAFKDDEAFNYLVQSCGACHGPDGEYKANWSMPAKDKLSISSLEGVEGITRAYQALMNKYTGNEGASPSAMPLQVDFSTNANAKKDAGRMLKWFAERLPGVVEDAKSLYPPDENGGAAVGTDAAIKVSLNYQCKQLRTGSAYLTKLTSALFSRNPNDAEFALIAGKNELPLSREERLALASRITTDPASMAEFEDKGLRNFAHKVADASNIQAVNFDAQATRTAIQTDLKLEFYQLLKKYYKEKPYRDILLMDKVMVTQRTAPLYNTTASPCTAPATATDWAECTLSPDRANFFGTVAFLRSRPVSYFENGNNYGRAGAMFVVASGEALLPQTNGPVGDIVNALPECLTNSTKDARGRVNPRAVAGVDEPLTGPYGSLTIPGFGNVCQGCHVRRGLAAGSKVYRSFGKFGEKLTEATIDNACGTPTANNPCPGRNGDLYRDDVLEAIKNDKGNYDNGQQRFAVSAPAQKGRDETMDRTSPVTVQFLKDLLRETTDGSGTCIPVDSKTIKPVSSIKDMAEFVVGSQANIARGLSRMIPKAIGATQMTNQEVIMAVNSASNKSNGLLADMIVAYLATETFACQEK